MVGQFFSLSLAGVYNRVIYPAFSQSRKYLYGVSQSVRQLYTSCRGIGVVIHIKLRSQSIGIGGNSILGLTNLMAHGNQYITTD